MIDYNVWEIKLTFNGSSYTLKEPKELENVESQRSILLRNTDRISLRL